MLSLFLIIKIFEGGLYPDKDGNRIRPFAINEMTMLTHYNEIQKDELQLLPLLPTKEEGLITKRNNLVAFAVGGDMVGSATGNGVWDPGSYGTYFLILVKEYILSNTF
jgi:hypothetical protein